jgi:hypothetical protein
LFQTIAIAIPAEDSYRIKKFEQSPENFFNQAFAKKIRKILKNYFFWKRFPGESPGKYSPPPKKIMALHRARTGSFPGSRARSSRTQPALSGIRHAEVP